MEFVINTSLPEEDVPALTKKNQPIKITQKVPRYLGETEWWLAKGTNHRQDSKYAYREVEGTGSTAEIQDVSEIAEIATKVSPVIVYVDESGNLVLGVLEQEELNACLYKGSVTSYRMPELTWYEKETISEGGV